MIYEEKIYYLYQYRRAVERLAEAAADLAEAENAAKWPGCGEGCRPGPNTDRMPRAQERAEALRLLVVRRQGLADQARLVVLVAIGRAPRKYRQVMRLRFISGLRGEELTRVAGLTLATAKRWCKRGIEDLEL